MGDGRIARVFERGFGVGLGLGLDGGFRGFGALGMRKGLMGYLMGIGWGLTFFISSSYNVDKLNEKKTHFVNVKL